MKQDPDDQTDTVGSATNGETSSTLITSEDTNMNDIADHESERKHTEPPEVAKDQGDDGGEELVGEEDTVIY